MTFFQENSLIFEAFLCLFKTDMGVSFRLLHLYSAACMLCTARFLLAMVWQLLQNKSRMPIGQEGLCFYIEKQSEPSFLSRRALRSECRVNAGLGQYKACQQNKSLASGQGWLFKKSRTKQIFHCESWNGCMFNNTLKKMQFFQKLFENVWKGKKNLQERTFSSCVHGCQSCPSLLSPSHCHVSTETARPMFPVTAVGLHPMSPLGPPLIWPFSVFGDASSVSHTSDCLPGAHAPTSQRLSKPSSS